MRWWSRVSDFLEKVLMAVACIILAGATLSLSAEALARSFFSRTWGLMEELPSLFMPYLVFLLLGVALKRNLHVSVDLFPAFLKGRAKAVLEAVIYLTTGVGSCFLLYGAMLGVKGFYQMGLRTTTEIAFPLWFFYLALAIGFGLLFFFAAEMFVRSIISMSTDQQAPGCSRENS
jgi:TRAP-type C4-dicarboxylate transport system permease small subunit